MPGSPRQLVPEARRSGFPAAPTTTTASTLSTWFNFVRSFVQRKRMLPRRWICFRTAPAGGSFWRACRARSQSAV
jgi:hypothetical protein